MLGLQSRRARGSSVSKSPNNIPQFPIAQGAVRNVNLTDVNRKGVPWREDFPVQVNAFSSLGGERQLARCR